MNDEPLTVAPRMAIGLGAEEQATAWRQAIIGLMLLSVGEIGMSLVDLGYFGPGWLASVRLIHAGLCVVLLGLLLARRTSITPALTIGAALAAVLPLFYILWISEALAATSLDRAYSPFYGHRLSTFAVALLMPGSLVMVAVLVVAFGAHAVALWFHLELADRPMLVAAGEPWFTLLYVALGFALLAYRWHNRTLARQFAISRAEAEALERLARLFLAVRDGANTPLQTLEASSTLLARRYPDVLPVVDRMKRSIARLRELMDSLASYEAWLRWQRSEESFDPRRVLRRPSLPDDRRPEG